MRFPILFSLVVTCSFLAGAPTYANVSLPAIFGDHMVLQRERENKAVSYTHLTLPTSDLV